MFCLVFFSLCANVQTRNHKRTTKHRPIPVRDEHYFEKKRKKRIVFDIRNKYEHHVMEQLWREYKWCWHFDESYEERKEMKGVYCQFLQKNDIVLLPVMVHQECSESGQRPWSQQIISTILFLQFILDSVRHERTWCPVQGFCSFHPLQFKTF